MLFDVVVAATLLWCVFLALISWGIAFVGSQRWLLVGEIVLQRGRPNNRPAWDFHYHFENHSSGAGDNVRAQAQRYLLRVVALTNATVVNDGYLLNVGTNTFHIGDRYVRRLRGMKDAKSHDEETCFFASLRIDLFFCSGGLGHAARGTGRVCITTTEEQSRIV